MFRLIVQRLAMAAPTLLLISIAVFAMIRLIPGDPALLMLGDMADPASLAKLRQSLGLDQPLVVQYLIWLKALFHGDLGFSITSHQEVLPLVLERFSVSVTIVLTAVALAAAIAVPLGMLAAWKQDTLVDLGLVTTATLLLSIPGFWMACCCCMCSAWNWVGCRWWATYRSRRISVRPWPTSFCRWLPWCCMKAG